jgi:hypothetical protein
MFADATIAVPNIQAGKVIGGDNVMHGSDHTHTIGDLPGCLQRAAFPIRRARACVAAMRSGSSASRNFAAGAGLPRPRGRQLTGEHRAVCTGGSP